MNFLRPKNLKEAVKLAAKHKTYKIIAGGTDICAGINSGTAAPEGLISLWNIGELAGINEHGEFIRIGALATHSDIIGSKAVQLHLPALAEACKTIGARQIQNRGTIGGNVMNASPAGDTLPVLLAYDAEVVVATPPPGRGKGEEKTELMIPFRDLYTGYRKTSLRPGEIIREFRIAKRPTGEKSAFMKIGTRRAQAISKAMGCFRIMLDGRKITSSAIAFGSIAPTPVRIAKAEEFLEGKIFSEDVVNEACGIISSEVKPIDDIRSTAAYRRHVCCAMFRRFCSA